MDCRACGTVNASGRRYCRECGGKLGAACPVCGFLNGFEDKYCGGCSRRAGSGGPLAGEPPPSGSAETVPGDDVAPGDEEATEAAEVIPAPAVPAPASEGTGQDVSQSEIDGLFENILEDGDLEGTA